jgi:hypothetical protein
MMLHTVFFSIYNIVNFTKKKIQTFRAYEGPVWLPGQSGPAIHTTEWEALQLKLKSPV